MVCIEGQPGTFRDRQFGPLKILEEENSGTLAARYLSILSVCVRVCLCTQVSAYGGHWSASDVSFNYFLPCFLRRVLSLRTQSSSIQPE